jgi:hypothetical protein
MPRWKNYLKNSLDSNMKLRKYLYILIFLCSQNFLLGVFAWEDIYYVVSDEQNLCGTFTPWNSWSPNWLMEWWRAVQFDTSLQTKFQSSLSCSEKNTSGCCLSLGYRYAWIPIWIPRIKERRKAAEFIATKWIIEKNNLQPNLYRLDEKISRKEVMKIIMQASQKEFDANCRGSFSDVKNDWGCKYIESALDYGFIAWNTSFRPNDSLSNIEALKLIFKAREIPKAYETGYWQEDYVATAYYKGLLDQKFSHNNAHISRWDIFLILARSYETFWSW